MTATLARSRHPARGSLVPLSILLTLSFGCVQAPPPSASGPTPDRPVDVSGVLQVLRSQGVGRCRGLVAYSAPGSGSRQAILRDIARELGADSSDPHDIAALVGRDLAGPNAAQGPVDAAAEGCLLGLRQGLETLDR